MIDNSLTAKDEIRRIGILCWLAEKEGGSGGYSLWTYRLHREHLWPVSNHNKVGLEDMRYLAANGWIEDDPGWQKVSPNGTDLEGIRVTITDAGLAKVHGLDKARGDKAARVAAIRAGVLSWLYTEDAVHGGHPVAEQSFFENRCAVFEGELFSGNELRAAYACLYRKGLVAGTDPDNPRPATADRSVPDGRWSTVRRAK